MRILDKALCKKVSCEDVSLPSLHQLPWSNAYRSTLKSSLRGATIPSGVSETKHSRAPHLRRIRCRPGARRELLDRWQLRTAIPDLRCEIEQMIVAGDRVVAHLRFRGHFTGRFGQIQGQGQTINFIATDIYRVADGRVAENWHIEDNLTLQQQLGLIPK